VKCIISTQHAYLSSTRSSQKGKGKIIHYIKRTIEAKGIYIQKDRFFQQTNFF